MHYQFPHTIQNCTGEKIIFREIVSELDGDRVLVENHVTPGHGPLMHTHYLQDESLTVISGRIGYQVKGEPAQYASAGETVFFGRGIPHRFWNAGQDELHCKGWIKPANTIVFYLTAIYAAQNKSGKPQPELFDGAFLIKRYASEYDLPDLPLFVKKAIVPLTYYIGRFLGKYKHFKDAPEPVKG